MKEQKINYSQRVLRYWKLCALYALSQDYLQLHKGETYTIGKEVAGIGINVVGNPSIYATNFVRA
jgi:hypothetical protein